MYIPSDVGKLAANALTDLAHLSEKPGCVENATSLAGMRAELWANNRDGINAVLNAAATNTIDPSLKRVAILQEPIRAFATRVSPLRLFSTIYSNVPLQGTDEVVVPYYALQTAAS